MKQNDSSGPGEAGPRILAFGAYDTRKPRVRLLLDAIRRAGALEAEIFIPVWSNVPQTKLPLGATLARVVARMLLGYPRAVLQLVRKGRHLARTHPGSAVLLPYPGILEILLIAPIARLLGLRVILDAFLPIYDTIVGDRSLVEGGWRAKAIWFFERAALRCADIIIVDTDDHGAYYSHEFDLPKARFQTVLVGAEPLFSPDAPKVAVDDILGSDHPRPTVLFYGQLIPLHGVLTILEAARISDDTAHWVVIGRGQLEGQVEEYLEEGGEALARRLTWIKWADYDALPSIIARADLCLGVFGASDKASRVIPNKLFQQVAMGKLVITRAGPAVDPIASQFPDAVQTVPADDPQALANAVASRLSATGFPEGAPEFARIELGPDAGVKALITKLSDPK